jgi:hypothetical protein
VLSCTLDLEIGDFTGDGRPDLVVGGPESTQLLTYPGRGDGTFGTVSSFNVGRYPRGLALGDLNGDDLPDIAATVEQLDAVAVLLNQGGGQFAGPRWYTVGDYPDRVAMADLDGDLVTDLAVANILSNDVSVLLGTGSGEFMPAVNYPAGIQPCGVVVGNFTGHQVPDLAVASLGGFSVALLEGGGQGVFAPACFYGVGPRSNDLAAGDFDGDLDLDIATNGYTSAGGIVSVLLGQGQWGSITETVAGDARELFFDVSPNLIASQGTLSFELARAAHVRLRVFDAGGRLVQVLLEEMRPAGRHHVHWNLERGGAEPVATGVYFLSLESEAGAATRRCVVVQ